jgi:hypothetical protein
MKTLTEQISEDLLQPEEIGMPNGPLYSMIDANRRASLVKTEKDRIDRLEKMAKAPEEKIYDI